MKTLLFLLTCLSISSAEARIGIDHPEQCKHQPRKVSAFLVSKDNKQLSYVAEGKRYKLASATDGVLVGRFRALMMSNALSSYDSKWLDIAEIPVADVESNKPRKLDYIVYYLPLSHALTPADLGLDANWRITDFVFDYDRRTQAFDGKEWQFIVKNRKTGASNTIMAAEAESSLLARCKVPR